MAEVLDKARRAVLLGKNRLIQQLASIGKDAKDIKAVLALMDWDVEIEQAVECFHNEAEKQKNKAG